MAEADNTSLQAQEVLLQGLQHASCFPHSVETFTLIQTHISWVLLTGQYAYKFKKPVNLGFLDFSTLALRKHFCEEELRLNRRFATELYLERVCITGSPDKPVLNGKGPVIEYAIKMKQFPQSAQLDEVLKQHQLTGEHIDKLAETVAAFHQQASPAAIDSEYGSAKQITLPVLENFAHIREGLKQDQFESRLKKLETWCKTQFTELEQLFQARKLHGFIREGHGDMHLRNIALLDNKLVLFDCLEFNPDLRWIDVINDIAFLIMDLDDRHQSPFAWRFLNRYMELSGDYKGIRLLTYYKVYRALVRAKVDAIRLAQPHLSEAEIQQTLKDFLSYLELTESYIQPPSPQLIITRGLSCSGKSTYTQQLLEAMGAIRIRSDVERKRLYSRETDRYNSQITQQVYQYLAELSGELLKAGHWIIVDATFMQTDNIYSFKQLAEQMSAPFHILEFKAKPDTLRNRIRLRKQGYSDATLKVLEQQLKNWPVITDDLKANLIELDTEQAIDIKQLATQLGKT